MKAATFFSSRDKETIEAVIAEVETRTAGEVAVMVVDKSDSYPEARLLAALVLGVPLALGLTDILFGDSLWVFLPLVLTCCAVLGLLSGFMPPVIRLIGSGRRMETRVRERALQAFYENGLDKTRDDTGVLFFISLLEHRVWVLADAGIYAKISSDELQDFARQVAQGIKTGDAATILCLEIQRIGEVLASHFPIRDDDTNELSNRVIVG